ncbi:alpha/beta hydrolase [Streptomyces sp. NBC_01264]|uniref:alpha/beta hydrolase n=1 Tax=Streptomyces sp. NBC_01264 TaxID=2903804 RepID=UPI002258B0C3|nr:alpha/beta hydrolase-fold protein [Streptomyces sp. NBC_01264]MCX4782959.1 esterase family protein [Streptomyces sp. NBC_01264]
MRRRPALSLRPSRPFLAFLPLRRAAALLAAAATAAAAFVVAAPAAPVGAASVLPSLPAPNAAGLTLRTWSVAAGQSERMGDASVTTSAIFAAHGGTPSINPVQVPVRVRILLPEDYQRDPAHPYPVLYLLHGGTGDVEQWSKTDEGNVTANLKDSAFKGIVVMPEGGKAGWYSDWAGHTDGFFAPQWETFHVQQLVPWIDANFNTVRAASGRAIAGVSMGGYGALRYAGRHPELFSAVGAFSPGTDIYDPGAQSIIANSTWTVGASILWTGLFDGKFRVTGDTPYRMATVFGTPDTWPGQNPVNLAVDGKYASYGGKMALYAGGTGGTGEKEIGAMTAALHQDLKDRAVGHRYCRGAGDHAWPYWGPELKDFVAYAYGPAPQTPQPPAPCPNDWGPETP